MSDTTNRVKIQNLRQQIYYEKLGIILNTINCWQAKKQARISQIYHEPFLNIHKQAQKIYKTTYNEANVLNNVLEQQRLFFYGIKDDLRSSTNVKLQEKGNTVHLSPQFSQIVDQFRKKKHNMIQLKQFLARFNSVLNLELTNTKKALQALQNTSHQLRHQIKDIDRKQADAISAVSTKKERKLLDLKKIHQIEQLFHKKVKQCQKTHEKLIMSIRNMRKMRNDFLGNIAKNLQFYRKKFNQCFNQDIGSKLQQFYLQRIKQSSKKIKEDDQYSQNSQQADRNKKEEAAQQIVLQLHNIFQDIIEQVSVRSWNVEVQKRENQKKEKRKKSFQITHQNKKQNLGKFKGHITIDNKFLFLKGIQIKNQLDLDCIFVDQASNENDQFLHLKDSKRKHSDELLLKFQNFQREDEFKLHLSKMQHKQLL